MAQKIKINNTDLEVSRINLGGNVFGWTLDEKQSFEILDSYFNAGFNFIDTADVYGKDGASEIIIGNWLKAKRKRSDFVIATKVGLGKNGQPNNISKKYILNSVDESLQRLQTDYIDLYYTHVDDNITPVEETLSAYDELIRAAKVRYIAASNISPERLTQSFEIAEKNGLPGYVALQPHYNLIERTVYETAYFPLVEKYGLTVFPYFSLASGFLTGKYRTEADLNKSLRGDMTIKYLNEKGLAILNVLDGIAAKHSTKQATVALAWLLAQPNIGAPIVSATSQTQLETLFAAPHLQLDKEDLELLDKVSR
ncbi:aldo/keto reductase [Sphingobacterium spiritivorum]|uniref:aldo/keto reductase n=1 Tax=Sphingobacterium spiritivorum TaxID=258 RepID=UPI003DA2AC0C